MAIITSASVFLEPIDVPNLNAAELAYVNGLIEVAEEYLQDRFWNRQIQQATYTDEKHNGTGEPSIFVLNPPIQSLTDIDIIATSFNADTTTTTHAATKFDYNPKTGQIRFKPGGFLNQSGGYFTAGFQNVQVTYSGGFVTVPKTIEYLISQFVIYAYDPSAIEGTIEKEKLGEYFYAKALELIASFPASTKKLFDSYRIRRVPSIELT